MIPTKKKPGSPTPQKPHPKLAICTRLPWAFAMVPAMHLVCVLQAISDAQFKRTESAFFGCRCCRSPNLPSRSRISQALLENLIFHQEIRRHRSHCLAPGFYFAFRIICVSLVARCLLVRKQHEARRLDPEILSAGRDTKQFATKHKVAKSQVSTALC